MQFDKKSIVEFAASLISFITVLFVSFGICFSAQDDNEDGQKPGLFSHATLENELNTTREPPIIRRRFVEINYDLLIRKDLSHEVKPAIANTLGLNLFDNVYFTVILDRLELRTIDDFSWIGHIEGMEYSDVILILKDRVMVGNITTSDAHYRVRYKKNDVHTISEIDRSAFLPELEPIPVE